MEVKCSIEKNLNMTSEKRTSPDAFQQFIKSLVKSEVKSVFKSLSEDGVQAGKKEIEKSKRK